MRNLRTFFVAAVGSLLAVGAYGQTVLFTFDSDQTDFGAFETTGTDVQLVISSGGVPVVPNDFSSLNGVSSITYSISGIELGDSNPFSVMITTIGGAANVDTSGLDVGGGGIDSGESISFVFSRNVRFSEFDLANLSTADTASVSVAGDNYIFDGSASNDVLSVDFSLAAGQTITFQNGGSSPGDYDIQGLTFDVSSVPEPEFYGALAGLLALGLAAIRRRRS